MASKLDHAIARVAIVVASWDQAAMKTVAAEEGASVTPKELAKLPDRWYPAVSAKGAGVPEHHESWQRYWFEAVAEILVQKKHDGMPGLLTFWERDEASDHDLILVRLLRLAADNVGRDEILDRVAVRFETLHYTKTYTAVRKVVNWTSEDSNLLALIEPMANIVIPRSDGDTLGKYINQMCGERAILDARKEG